MLNPYITPGITQSNRNIAIKMVVNDHPMPWQITHTVCKYFNVSHLDLQRKTQKRTITEPRQICFYLLCTMTSLTLTQIGSLFNKDHSNVIFSRKLISNMIHVDKSYAAKIKTIKDNIL